MRHTNWCASFKTKKDKKSPSGRHRKKSIILSYKLIVLQLREKKETLRKSVIKSWSLCKISTIANEYKIIKKNQIGIASVCIDTNLIICEIQSDPNKYKFWFGQTNKVRNGFNKIDSSTRNLWLVWIKVEAGSAHWLNVSGNRKKGRTHKPHTALHFEWCEKI